MQLARAVGVSERNVVRWETGRNQPRAEYVFAIAEVCRVHVADLYDGGGDSGRDSAMTREQALLNVGLAVEQLLAVQT